MKSLNKTETPIFFICYVFFVSKGNLFSIAYNLRGNSDCTYESIDERNVKSIAINTVYS